MTTPKTPSEQLIMIHSDTFYRVAERYRNGRVQANAKLLTVPVEAKALLAEKPRICEHCKKSFVGALRHCSDECLFEAHPDLRPRSDIAESLTLAQKREAEWECGLPARQREYDYERLKPSAKRIGKMMMNDWGTGRNTLLTGASESCKTFVAYRLARLSHMQGKRVLHLTADKLRKCWLDGVMEKRDTMARFMRAPVLLIDDLGMEPTSDGWCAEIYALINSREEDGLVTIVTANKDRDYFTNMYSPAFANRLWRMKVHEF